MGTLTGSKRASVPQDNVPAKRRKVKPQVDTLPWRAVAIPENLDDYSGLYGLEEVDDVRVVREGQIVSYEVPEAGKGSKTTKTAKKGDKKISSKAQKPQSRNGHVPQPVEKEDVLSDNDFSDAWSGFGEDEDRQGDDLETGETSEEDGDELGSQGFELLTNGLEGDDDVGDATASTSSWNSLSLSTELRHGLGKLGFNAPTPIQRQSIPLILSGKDVIGKARTGSGKTLAFGLPIMQRWLEERSAGATALIIEPTRELAAQVADHFNKATQAAGLQSFRTCVLTGGLALPKQLRLLRQADAVIATPGRLWEILSSGGDEAAVARLKHAAVLVIDEADRLLGEGHFADLKAALDSLDRRVVDDAASDEDESRQTLVFSATLAKTLRQRLAGKRAPNSNKGEQDQMAYLLDRLKFNGKPTFVDAESAKPDDTDFASTKLPSADVVAPSVRQGLLEVPADQRDLYLYSLLCAWDSDQSLGSAGVPQRTLVFVNSIAAARRLAKLLAELGLDTSALHSGMIQKARLRAVERFSGQKDRQPQAGKKTSNVRAPRGQVLVATDVAARGLDIAGITLVIHYHAPRAADMYVHRSGRTGRAAAVGHSILLCSPQESTAVSRLVHKVVAGKTLHPVRVPPEVISALRPRVDLASKLAATEVHGAAGPGGASANKPRGKHDALFRQAAADLGWSDGEDPEASGGARGRGTSNGSGRGGRAKAAPKHGALAAHDVAGARAALAQLLSRRVLVKGHGFSERYLTGGNGGAAGLGVSGGVDVAALLAERAFAQGGGASAGRHALFLGTIDGVQF